MHKFYFNECLQAQLSTEKFAQLLSDVIKEYDILVQKKELSIENGIITEKIPSELNICGVNLKDAILAIKNKEIKNLAFAYFTKYPIDNAFYVDEDYLIQIEYKFEGFNALNLAIVALNSSFLFSVAVNDAVKKDRLEINSIDSLLNLENLYGKNPNTLYIEDCIKKLNIEKLTKYEQLKAELDKFIISTNFERSFLSENPDVQDSILNAFKEAKKRHLKTPYYPDTTLIKDVTPNCNKKANVYELRVRSPKALRVYFYEAPNNVIYIAKMGYKADYKEENAAQNKDISLAHNMLHTMVVTSVQ